MTVAALGAGVRQLTGSETASGDVLGQLGQQHARPLGQPQPGAIEALDERGVALLVAPPPRPISATVKPQAAEPEITPSAEARRIEPLDVLPANAAWFHVEVVRRGHRIRHLVATSCPPVERAQPGQIRRECARLNQLRVAQLRQPPLFEVLRIVLCGLIPHPVQHQQEVQPHSQRLRVLLPRQRRTPQHPPRSEELVDPIVRPAVRSEQERLTMPAASLLQTANADRVRHQQLVFVQHRFVFQVVAEHDPTSWRVRSPHGRKARDQHPPTTTDQVENRFVLVTHAHAGSAVSPCRQALNCKPQAALTGSADLPAAFTRNGRRGDRVGCVTSSAWMRGQRRMRPSRGLSARSMPRLSRFRSGRPAQGGQPASERKPGAVAGGRYGNAACGG
jgi:hypothetical protein